MGSLGDTLVALPSLHLVERAFPTAERRLLTNFPVSGKAPAAAAVLGESGLVHGYERYTVGMRSPLELLKLALRIRRFRPDTLVYLMSARGTVTAERDLRFFRSICGIRNIIGVPVTEDMQRCRVDAAGRLEPEASRLSRNIGALGEAYLNEPASWDMRLAEEEFAAADRLLQPVAHLPCIAVSVGTKVQAKDWGRDNWRALLSRVAELYPNHGLVLAGAPEESEASEFASDGWCSVAGAGPVVNLCGKLSPRESAAAFSRCRVFLGHDSGPMHLAASVQTPCVAIFAARNKPRMWFPFGEGHRVIYHHVDCWGCALETCVEQKRKCLLSITVDEVLAALTATMKMSVTKTS
ncbi:glycosyltransferase family 9 protein [Terriglobus sp. RCC_193]|uniref:glycosyltransferase family 9 protein n=1 Tax=Terriglobus sp. RCC_193 TaxID=3239218 RepID=UPI0035248759